jgi:hypothetical protein
MLNNRPTCLKIVRLTINGGDENVHGATQNFGKVTYYLPYNGRWEPFSEEELCDTFEQLRDRVFSDDMRNNIIDD